MTTRPKLRLGGTLAPGLLAVALLGLMSAIALNTAFDGMTGYPDGLSIVSEIGYAMFDLEALQSGDGSIPDTETFLGAFLLIAIVLDAALDASLVLAKREDEGEPVSALSSRGTDSASPSESGATVADGGSSATGGSEPAPRAEDSGAADSGGDSR